MQTYLPQSPCPLLLVDVDEVAHHPAVDHISLSLHADLEEPTETDRSVEDESIRYQCKMLRVCKDQRGRTFIWVAKG